MAAAHLRQAVTKVVGDQRTQAAVRRRLFPRLFHTDEARRLEEEEARALTAIQDKKEELYNMISEARAKKYDTGLQTQRMHRYLSAQISPRPYDSKWRWLRKLDRINSLNQCMLHVSSLAGYMVLLPVLVDLGVK